MILINLRCDQKPLGWHWATGPVLAPLKVSVRPRGFRRHKNPVQGPRMSFRDAYLRRTYGLTELQVERMIAAQGGACAVCATQFEGSGKDLRAPVVDHCHRTGTIRDVLCNGCNRTLGFVDDDADLLVAMAAYIRDHAPIDTADDDDEE